jgi:hypothetical protein
VSHETLTKRTIWVAACECGERSISETCKREAFCKCGKWVPYEEQSWTGGSVSNVPSRAELQRIREEERVAEMDRHYREGTLPDPSRGWRR